MGKIRTEYYSHSAFPASNVSVEAFVSQRVFGKAGAIERYCTMAVFDDDKLIAGTIYHNYYPESGVIELTSASDDKRWLTKRVVRAMFWLPFERLGCQLVVLRVSERNESMIKISRKFGFSEVYIPRLRGRDEGEFIFSLTDDQWRSSKYYGEGA